MFSVRLASADSYQAQPLPQLDPTFSEFRGTEIKHVPIIRIFGPTSNGEKTCLHIHGVFPYLYVPYTGEEDPTSLVYRLAASLDAAINVSLGSATSNTQHVYLIQRVSGIPFYGYHRKEHQYLKIYFYNPAMIKRAADLLLNGSVLNQSFQPHEAHIPYLLQFMIDYNVYGMSLINLSCVKHRRLTQTLADHTSSGQSVTSENSEIEYLPATIERQSTCEIEIDALALDITNRREIENGLELNPGLAAIWEEERARRAQAGLQGGDSQLVNPKSPPRPIFRPTDNDIYQEQRLARRLLMISQCDESTLSTTTTNQSVAYAAEVQEGENLLNSSHLLFSRPTIERTQFVGQEDSTVHATFHNSPTEVASQRMTPERSILGTDDASLVDLLVQLAGEDVENQESVDMDSLLGSQVQALLNNEESDNEEDEDAIDLNLTSLQLDSLSSLEIAAEQGKESSMRELNSLNTINLSPFTSSHETSGSVDEEKRKKGCRLPQYDGAGDVSPTFLNSDSEDNATNTKDISHLPEYSGKIDNLEQTLKVPSNNAFFVSKDSDKSGEHVRNSSPVEPTFDSSSLLPVLTNDAHLAHYNGLNYEPLDRLLEIDSEFDPDLEDLHSSLEIGILLSSADSDSPESINEALEDDAIPLETVLNGDPCFTECAELDKSDLTELQDQYDSLLGNSLLPDVRTNLRVDSDLGNSSNYSDSDYQTGEKPCEILLNVRSPRSSVMSRESSSSSENVTPNIQEPENKGCYRGKFDISYPLDRASGNCKDATRISNDNSDYNCNVVATWAELQNLQFVEKEKMEGRLGRSKERGQYSQGPRQTKRRANRRSDERAPSQILSLDCEKINNATPTLSSHQMNNNCLVSPRKIVASIEKKSPIRKSMDSLYSPIVAESTAVETRPTESLVDIIDEKCSKSPRVPHIAEETKIEQQTIFADPEIVARLNTFHRSIIGSGKPSPDVENSFSIIRDVEKSESLPATVDFEKSSEKELKIFDEPHNRTKQFPEGFSYYSSQRSERDYTVDGFEHRHCQLSKHNRIIQDEVFTSEQLWVIEKRKRGRQMKWRHEGECNSGDCGVPIVPLRKIDGKCYEIANIFENSEKIEDTELESPENQIVISTTEDVPAEKCNLTKKRAVARKSRVRRKRIDTSSSDSDSSIEDNENIDTINDSIDSAIKENRVEPKDPESSDWAETEGRHFVREYFSASELVHKPYATRRTYSRRKRSIARNSNKLISTRALKTTRNGVCRRVSRANKCKSDNLPGIPGIIEYRSSRKRNCTKKDVLNCCNEVTGNDKPTETSMKTKNKLQSVLFTNWESKREVSNQRPNGIVNIVQNGISDDRKTIISSNGSTINSQFDFPPISPIPKENRSSRDASKDFSLMMNQSSTPKKINPIIEGTKDKKLLDCVTLNLMMKEVKSRSTRAKLKILLEKRQNKAANNMKKEETKIATEGKSLDSDERISETKAAHPENPELPPISSVTNATRNSIGVEEIHDKLNVDNDAVVLKTSFETATDVNETSHKKCEPVSNSFDIVDNTLIFTNSSLSTDLCNTEGDRAAELFQAELEILGNGISERNPAVELSNERKELSYQNHQFGNTIAETNFFTGNNYTIDAVSHEMPACLFEEDSNSVEKRSPKKFNETRNLNDTQNAHDAYSDISVDPRDLDVYDVESLTPCSSLATLDEVALDVAETSLNISKSTESSFVESWTNSEARSVSSCQEKSRKDSKCETTEDSSFEEASPEFEALSPSPKICDLGKSLEEDFTVHFPTEIANHREKLNNSFTDTIDDSLKEAQGGNVDLEEETSKLDHEIQDLVSQVIVQFEKDSKHSCESESELIIEVLSPDISGRSEEVAAGIEIEEPETLTRTEKKLPIAPEENQQLFSKNEWMASATLETNGEAPAVMPKEFAKGIDSEKLELLPIIQNRTQSDVLESPIKFQQVVTPRSELMDRRLESKDVNKELTESLTNEPIKNNENNTGPEIEHCMSKNEELASILINKLPKKPLKCRPISIKLVNIDLSRFKGFTPKKFTRPNVTKLESMLETVGNNGTESLTAKNIVVSTTRNILNENVEEIGSKKFELKEKTITEDKEMRTWREKGISESTTLIEISDEEKIFEKSFPIESTTPIVISSESETFEETIPIESTALIKNSDEKEEFEKTITMESRTPIVISSETFEETIPIESTALIKNSDEREEFEKTITMESTTPIVISSETFEETIPIESTALIKNSDEREEFERTIPMESTMPIVISSETFVETIPIESAALIQNSDESETFETKIPMESTALIKISDETKSSSQKSAHTRSEKVSRPPERRSMRKCAEKTRQKLSQQASSRFSDTEFQSSMEENNEIVTENNSHEPESWLQEKSKDLPSQKIIFSELVNSQAAQSLKSASNDKYFGNLTENSSTSEISAQEGSLEEKGEENSFESVLSTQHIPNENTALYDKWKKRCCGGKSHLGNSPEASPENNAATEVNMPENELTSQIIMDENIKPKSHYYTSLRTDKSDYFVKHRKIKRTTPLQLQLASQRLVKVSLDLKTSARQISFDNKEQENTCSLYHQQSSQKIVDTKTEANNSNVNSVRSNFERNSESSEEKLDLESKSLEGEKNSPRSVSVTSIINEDNVNSEFSETPELREHSTKIPDANVENPSTETASTLEESAQDRTDRDSEGMELISDHIAKDDTETKIFLEADNSESSAQHSVPQSLSFEEQIADFTEKASDDSELLSLKTAEDKESRISLTPEKAAQDTSKTNSEGFDLSSEIIEDESFLRIKKRRGWRKISESDVDEPSPEVKPSQDEGADNIVEKTSETHEETLLTLQKIGEEHTESKISANAEIPELNISNSSLEINAENITKEISQGLKLSPQKITEEPETCVNDKRTRCRLKVSEPNVKETSTESISSLEKNNQVTDEKTFEIPEKSKLSQEIEEQDDRSKASTDVKIAELNVLHLSAEKSAHGLELSPQKIEKENTEPVTPVNVKKRGRPRKNPEPNAQKLSMKPISSIEESSQITKAKTSEKSKISQEIAKEDNESKASVDNEIPEVNTLNFAAEKSAYRLESLPQNIEKVNTESLTGVKVKRKGRSRKISESNAQNLSAKPVPSLEENAEATKVKTWEIFEKSKLSQKTEKGDGKSKTSADIKIPKPNTMNLLAESMVEGLKLALQKFPKENADSKAYLKVKRRGRPASKVSLKVNRSGLPLKTSKRKIQKSPAKFIASIEESTQTSSEKTCEIGEDSNLSEKLAEDVSGIKKSIKESDQRTETRNIEEEVSSKPEKPLNSTEEDGKSKKSLGTKSTLVETSQDIVEDDSQRNDSLLPNSGDENIELETKGLRKKLQDNVEKSSPSDKNVQDNSENSQKLELLPQSIEQEHIKTKSTTKRRDRCEINCESNVQNEILKKENSKSIIRAVSQSLEKSCTTPKRRSRAVKATESNSLKPESIEENIKNVTEKSLRTTELLAREKNAETKNPVSSKRRLRSEKNTESSADSISSENNDPNTADKAAQEMEILSGKSSSEEDTKIARIIPRRKGRFVKSINSQKLSREKSDQNIAKENLQGSESSLSLNAKRKDRRGKISRTIVDESSQESSTEEISQKIRQNTSRENELSQKLKKDDIESKIPVTSRRKGCFAKNSEDIEKFSAEEISVVIERKMTEDAAKPKSPARSKKRTRLDKSPEAKFKNSELSKESTRKNSNETFEEFNLLVRPRKRVHFDEDTIRDAASHSRNFEKPLKERIEKPSSNKHRKYSSATLNRESSPPKMMNTRDRRNTLNRELLALRGDQKQRQRKNLARLKGNNGVEKKSKLKISSNDNASFDLPSLQNGFMKQRHHVITRGITVRLTKVEASQEKIIQSKERLPSTKTQINDSEVNGQTKKTQFLTNSKLCKPDSTRHQWQSEQGITASLQLQEPKIILKRLNRDTLKTYGYKFIAKTEIFVKILKQHRPDPEYQVPAYDGAADLSSSDSDDDPADVTIAREEKRVCVYQSGKKSANTRRDAIITPKKRKCDEAEEIQSPTSKRRTLSTPGPSSKAPYFSPNRTSMLKSPGRVSGYYRPLQIIVTSPKVRKETSERQDIDVRLENRDVPASIVTCLTPRRKNDQRLHEKLVRGRITATNSPRNCIGDKGGTPVTKLGPQRLGELDEINSSERRERNALNTPKITSECPEATGNENLTTTHRDGKDVRKKLVFSTAGDERRSDSTIETSNAELHQQSTNFRTFDEPVGQFSTINDAREPLEFLKNLANGETTMLEPQPGSSRSESIPKDENQKLYEVTTDEESEDACNVTFTQYIDSQIEKNQSLALDRSKINEESNEIVSLRPKFDPPSRQRITDTMETYGIPKYYNQEPFFSDEADVPKQKELANKMLKVHGKGLKSLPPFVSSVEGVTGLARLRKMKINEFQPALAKSKDLNAIRALVGDDRVSLTPVTKPPAPKEVKNWLRAREYLDKKKKQEEMATKMKEQQKIIIQDQIAKIEENECESNSSDLSVIEASPEKIIGASDSKKMLDCTLKMKLAKKRLFEKSEELQKSKLLCSEGERTKDSIKTSESGEGQSSIRNFNNTVMDPSLLNILEKSRLFKDQEASRHLGVSRGQIEFLSDSTRSNVDNENLQNAKALTRYQYLTIMCLEVHVTTRGDLLPDSQYDPIAAIFYSVQNDVPPTSNIKPLEHGVMILADEEKAKNKMHYTYASNIPWSVSFANNEEALLNALVNLITRTDPEILIGWELESLSWGYVFQRASRLGMNLFKRISRIPATHCKWETPAPDIESIADVKLPGRIVLDVWRLMRHEAALLSYTFESMMHHILNERVPCPSFKILTNWWNLERPRSSRWRVVEHYSIRVLGIFRMLDHLDIIGRTSELARLFGIQFYEVFSRGSQYRVESVMHRLAKPLNYIAVSPSPLQRASMRAMEALPLIMEPESMFYSDPLIVLDFQSLYPSIIIAHNYCFSTCLGRIEHIGQPQPFEFGAYTLRVPKTTSLKLQGKVNFAPCGVAFVKPEVRLGILPRMLTEILETRFMVKKAMKDHKNADKTLQRALHSRQLGLKLLANVTYGYTAANFSGRMPCIEVGDSVVSKSKETLERAIKLIEATPRWGARVVYGDTDSLFILVPGKSKADAFVIGNEIADAVTASNPPPIKLKFEKVMYPSILQTKKRYCGYMYETPDQETPTYLAKGIETVRRDGCPAVSKVLEKTLKILFETKDLSLVKKYVTRQLDKVLRGKVSIQDLTFAKEFRGLKGYRAKACVPALELTRRLMKKDPRAVPRNSERVRYVIVAGAPNQALIHCVRTPWELINDPGLRPNAVYYVTRVIIPPLNRCLNLMGVDVNAWYREMPHRQILDNPVGQPIDKQKLTIFQYFGTIVCVSCGQPSNKGICTECLSYPADTLVVLHEKLRWLHRNYDQVTAICQSCVGQADVADCSSLDCPVLYRRAQAQRDLSQAINLRNVIECGNNLEF